LPNSYSIDQDNSNEFERVIQELSIQKTDRILFIGSGNLSFCLLLCNQAYEKLYLIDTERNVYNNPFYTNIRYLYQKDFKMHFPFHFFKVILVSKSNFDEDLYDYVQGGGAIIASYFNMTGERVKENFAFKMSSRNTSKDVNFNSGNEGQERGSFRIFKVDNAKTEGMLPTKLDIICYSGKEEGIYIHSKILKERLETEYGMLVNLTDTIESVQSSLAVFEYHPGHGKFDRLFEDITSLLNGNTIVILENHGSLRNFTASLKILIDKGLIVTYRSPEIAEQDHIERYSILPVLTYKNINIQQSVKIEEIRIGTFGFIGKQKGTSDIISLAFRLKVQAELLLGVNPTDPSAEKKIVDFKRKYGKRKNISIRIYNKQITHYVNGLVNVYIGNHTDMDIIDTMSKCSHIAFAHRTRMEESGAIKYAKRLSKPIFALDSFQSRIGQVYRFSKFTNLTPFRLLRENIIEASLAVNRKEQKLLVSIEQIALSFFVQLKALFKHDSPDKKSLVKMYGSNVRDEDGLDYLSEILKYMGH
jgi:hypothetical protein